MTPEAVVFDIGNVLIGWQPERAFDQRVGPERRAALFDTIDLHAMNDRVDLGENFHDVLAEAIAQHPDFATELAFWRDDWLSLTGPVIDHSLHLLRALRSKGFPVFALSNFGVETYNWAQDFYPFLREFDREYVSGHMRLSKPDAAIYRALEADCGFAPNALLFTDDRAENIHAAKSRGWHTHLFDDTAGWAQCLVNHGLLTKEEAS